MDDDLSVSLPQSPPPNPARREAAIEAALRRFDGADEEATTTPDRPRPVSPPWWIRLRQPQFGVALSVAIVAVIGIPAALIAIRDRPPAPVQETAAPPATRSAQAVPLGGNASLNEQPAPISPSPVAKVPPASVAPPTEPSDSVASSAHDELAKEEPPPAAMYAPAPPPPQAAPVVAESGAGQQAVGNVIVTGTRVAQPSPERVARKASRSADAAARAPADSAGNSAYASFVTRLQAAVRTSDRSAVIKLIGFPLRVNSNGRSRFYPDARSAERDFDRIFTPRVRQAILAQRPDQLFTRDQGAMIGDGQVWFDHSCLNSGCTALGPVRITAVNP